MSAYPVSSTVKALLLRGLTILSTGLTGAVTVERGGGSINAGLIVRESKQASRERMVGTVNCDSNRDLKSRWGSR